MGSVGIFSPEIRDSKRARAQVPISSVFPALFESVREADPHALQKYYLCPFHRGLHGCTL
jgi:hypothetical protein